MNPAPPSNSRIVPRDAEVGLAAEDLFFSTTDEKGRITDGNEVFSRVCEFPRDELIGRPHNVVRHPDMPRTIFRNLWTRLRSGQSVAAYVKNVTASGSHYWVCALVSPAPGGFFSIRFRPCGRYFEPVGRLYAEMRRIEREVEVDPSRKNEAMAASEAHLLEALPQLGIADFDELIRRVLIDEMSVRRGARPSSSWRAQAQSAADRAGTSRVAALLVDSAGLGEDIAQILAGGQAFSSLEGALADNGKYVGLLSGDLRILSLNAQVSAAGLQENGRTLQVIAQHMSENANELTRSSGTIRTELRDVASELLAAACAVASSDLSVEMMAFFLEELARIDNGKWDADARSRVARLAEVVSSNLESTYRLVGTSNQRIRALESKLEGLTKAVRTLEILHVTGKVETVSCGQGKSVSHIFDSVYTKTHEARERLVALVETLRSARITLTSERQTDMENRISRLKAA